MSSRPMSLDELRYYCGIIISETGRIADGSVCAGCDLVAARIRGEGSLDMYAPGANTIEVLIRDPNTECGFMLTKVEEG